MGITSNNAPVQIEPGELKDLSAYYANSTQDTKGGYGADALEEIRAIGNGSFQQTDNPFIVAPILAQAQIRFCDGTGFLNQKVACKKITSTKYSLPIQEIHATLQDSGIAPNPFANSQTYEGGVSHFKYTGEEPAHVLLSGSIKLLVRLSDTLNEEFRLAGTSGVHAPTIRLMLGTTSKPQADNILNYQISCDHGWHPRPLFKLDPFVPYRIPLPNYEELSVYLKNAPKKSLTIVDGSIAPSSISSGNGTPNIGHRMTSWFNIGAESHLWMKTDGLSAVSYIQWKDKHGNIHYDNRILMGGQDSNRIVKVPEYATQARVWFNSGNNPNTNTSTTIEIKAVPEKYDPYYGVWAEYNFNISTLHYFEPNTEYYFSLEGQDGNKWNFDTRGFINVSGGIDFTINARKTLQQRFDDLRGV
ncbi:hypothetical protein [Acinetobacter rudis]|uniref:hypothetical protein n=1 Tax=Acinetobacter rudis TaxID=632955 RepID=UPI003340941E